MVREMPAQCDEGFGEPSMVVPKLWLMLKLFRATYAIVVYKSISGMENVTFLR
jgi:hypothetical protein